MKRKVYQELIDIINCVLSEKEVHDIQDWWEINELAKRHRLCGFVYEAIKFREDVDGEELRRIRNKYFASAGQQMRQEHYATELFSALRAKGIPYAPLRGYAMRKLYAKGTLRMSDNVDVLCRPEHREEVAGILLSYGFRREVPGETEDHYILDHVTFHIYTNLKMYHDSVEQYYRDVWDKMVTQDGVEYAFRPEDFYVYQMTAMEQQFAVGGVGIRSVTDLAILKKTYPDLDWEYIRHELAVIGVLGFSESMEKLADVWFFGGQIDDDTLLLGKFIAGFGTPEYAELMYAAETAERSERDKQKYRTRRFFLPYRVMKMRYPVLRKCGFLLPAFWVGRVFSIAFSPRQAKNQELEADTLRRRAEELANRLRVIAALDEEPGERLRPKKPPKAPAQEHKKKKGLGRKKK